MSWTLELRIGKRVRLRGRVNERPALIEEEFHIGQAQLPT